MDVTLFLYHWITLPSSVCLILWVKLEMEAMCSSIHFVNFEREIEREREREGWRERKRWREKERGREIKWLTNTNTVAVFPLNFVMCNKILSFYIKESKEQITFKHCKFQQLKFVAFSGDLPNLPNILLDDTGGLTFSQPNIIAPTPTNRFFKSATDKK